MNGLLFAMSEGKKAVSVVTHEALEDISSPPLAEGSYEQTFYANRRIIEEIASNKFDQGQIEADGSVRVSPMMCVRHNQTGPVHDARVNPSGASRPDPVEKLLPPHFWLRSYRA
jgi:hypothetical protein